MPESVMRWYREEDWIRLTKKCSIREQGISACFGFEGLLRSLFLCAGFIFSSTPAYSTIVDLTSGAGSQGTINGGLFIFGDMGGGTGLIKPYVRIRESGTEQGYNTSNSVLPFDEKKGSWTHDLRLNEIPIVTIDGVGFFEFVLDTNESRGGGNQFISLDDIKIYTSTIGGQNTTNIDSLGIKRYDMDAFEDSHVRIDSSLNSGSGQTDMTVFIPVAMFAGASPTDFVYFYSHFGGLGSLSRTEKYGTSAGFEEWAVQITEGSVFIPSPGAAALGLLSFLIGSRRRRREA